MPVIDVFDDVIINPLNANGTVQEWLNLYSGSSFDRHIRVTELRKAQSPCDTELLSQLYCYTYMLQHMDGYKSVILRNATFFTEVIFERPDQVLFVDCGCGPMTSALALVEHLQIADPARRLSIDYVGLDREHCMLDIANAFAFRPELFGGNLGRLFLRDWQNPPVDAINALSPQSKTLIFNFSYLFSQTGFEEQFAMVRDFILRIMSACRTEDIYMIYLNTVPAESLQSYRAVAGFLGFDEVVSDVLTHDYRVMRRLEHYPTLFSSNNLHYTISKFHWSYAWPNLQPRKEE